MSSRKIGAIVQARFSSTRLPGKILKKLPYGSNITALAQVIRRLKRSKEIDDIVVATTQEKESPQIINIAKSEKVKHFRGSTENVLSRYYMAAKENAFDIIVRITSDCPCVDPEITDLIIKKYLTTKADYMSNTLKRAFPRGLDVEVFSFDALERAYKNANKDFEKEHVTPYIYGNPRIFKVAAVKSTTGLRAPQIRITLDTEEDYALLCTVFDNLYYKTPRFTAYDIIKLFKKKPWLELINKKIIQKKIQA